MSDDPIDLDKHRGMAAQKATDLRRQLQNVQADQVALRTRQLEFEEYLETVPAKTQQDAVLKAKYLVQLYADTREGTEPRRARLIARSLEELDRLFSLTGPFTDPEPKGE
jgi:hypothetical protein